MTEPVRVAVITPYYREPDDFLQRCIDSVAAQSHPCTHYMVSDGFPSECVARARVEHIRLPHGNADYGDTPRAIGSLQARRDGAQALVYLDADNYYLPDHVAALIDGWESHQRALDVLSTERLFIRPDGSEMPLREPLGAWLHCDTNCLFLANAGLLITELWATMPAAFHAFGDRVIWNALKARKLRIGHLPRPTVAYTTRWAAHYATVGEPLPPDVRDITPKMYEAAAWWHALPEAARLVHCHTLGFDPTPSLAPFR